MVSSGKINSDWDSIKSILDKYQLEIDGLDSNWKGPSRDSLVTKSQSFLSEYTNAIGEQMNAFASASDLYEQYEETKKNIATAKQRYSAAVSKKDNASASRYISQINTLKRELSDLKSQIETKLHKASSTKLSASSTNADSLIVPELAEQTTETSSLENEIYNGASMGYQGVSTGGSSYYYGNSGGGTVSENSFVPTIAPSTGSTQSIDYGNLDMTNYPKGSSKEDGMARSILVAKYLIENGGFTKEQAAAIVGVYLDENNCNPGNYMSAEKNGKGTRGTGGSGYGAGIASWTFSGYKKQCLSDAGYPTNTPIESLSLQQQCDMVIAMSQKSNKKYFDALKRCNTIEDAAATAYIITGGVGASTHWSTHPTTAEARALSNKYGRNNDARFGRSSYHWNSDQRRLAYAKQIYQYL